MCDRAGRRLLLELQDAAGGIPEDLRRNCQEAILKLRSELNLLLSTADAPRMAQAYLQVLEGTDFRVGVGVGVGVWGGGGGLGWGVRVGVGGIEVVVGLWLVVEVEVRDWTDAGIAAV